MPATPRHTSRARVEAKESSILDAAEKIFAQVGFDGAKVSDIARAASVAEGTVYLYYKNKQDLLAGVVGRFWTQLTLGAEAAIDPMRLQQNSWSSWAATTSTRYWSNLRWSR